MSLPINIKTKKIMKQILKTIVLLLVIFIITSNISKAQNWIAKANIAQSATGRGAAQTFVLNNKLYVAGGYIGFSSGYTNDMQMYDPASNTWTGKASPSEPNRSSGIAFVINGKAYMGLGAKNFLSFSPPETPLTDLNEYNETSNSWSSKASFPDSGRTASASFVLNNKAYIVGGERGVSGLKTSEVWEYNPSTNAWTKKNDFTGGGIAFASTFTIGSKSFLTGGILSDGTISNKTYEYNATADTWTQKANLPISNQGGIAFTIGNDAYYGLGSDKNLGGSGAVFPTTFYKYNSLSDTWTATTHTWSAAGRLWSIAGVINNKAYVGAGYKFASGEFAYKDIFELAFAPNTINEMKIDNNSIIYPNPAKNQFYVNAKGKEINITIYTSLGQIVKSQIIQEYQAIDISSFQTGNYFVTINSNHQTQYTQLKVVR